nr:hypothetical protein [uncultured Pseudodesulfovibrio sp.]
MRILIIPAILVLSFIVYLSFSNPNMIVVSEDLILNDISNQTREAIQGKDFWTHQLSEVKRLKRQLEEDLDFNRKQKEKYAALLQKAQLREDDITTNLLSPAQKEALWVTKEANLTMQIGVINRQYEHSRQIYTDDSPELNKLMEKIQGRIKTLN